MAAQSPNVARNLRASDVAAISFLRISLQALGRDKAIDPLVHLAFPPPARENEPAVERGGAALAATTRLDSGSRRDSFDNIAQADVFVGNKSGKAHSIRLAFSFTLMLCLRFFLLHDAYLCNPAFNNW